MGSMMGMVNGFAIMIYMVLIYLLSKIIIEKNAQSISMVKILGYTNGEISKLYIMSTSLVVVFCLLLSLPLETVIMKVLFREMMLSSISGWITLWIDPMIYVQMFAAGIITYGIMSALVGVVLTSKLLTCTRVCLKNKNCTKRMFYFPFS